MTEPLILSWPDLGGGVLRVAREARGVTREEVAERIGVGAGAIANMENGHRPPSNLRLSEWADALDMSEGPFHRLRDLADGRLPLRYGAAKPPSDETARRKLVSKAIREELSAVLDMTAGKLLPEAGGGDGPLLFHVRLPGGDIREIRAERRSFVVASRATRGEGPLLSGYLAALAALERDPSKTWSGPRDDEMRLGLAIVDMMRVMDATELGHVRGYLDRIFDERG